MTEAACPPLHHVRAGRGRPLVLLHGWCMTHRAFYPLLDSPPAGGEVIAFDLPGHGQSGPPCGVDLALWAGAVARSMASLQLDRPILCGWSLGGMLALLLAAQQSAEFSGMVLISTTPRFTNGDGWTGGLPPGQLAAMKRDVRRAYRPTMEAFFRMMFAEGEVDAYGYRQIARKAVSPRTLPPRDVAEDGLAILAQTDLRSILTGISVPTLVVHGDRDPIIPPAAGRFLAEKLAGSRLEILSGIGHAPFLSRPERFRAMLEQFVHES